MITQELIKRSFVYSAGVLYWRYDKNKPAQWNTRYEDKMAGTENKNGRFYIQLEGKRLLRYRLIWLMFNGTLPEELDHINRDQSDDRIENLREADRFINAWNCVHDGVTRLLNGRFRAQVKHKGKITYLGSYTSWQEAHDKYNERVFLLRGDYAPIL